MPYVTRMQVMEAVFSKQQISAIMTMRRNDYWSKESKDTEAQMWATRLVLLHDAIGTIEHYRGKAKAKCLKSDDKWRSRLVTTDFWQQQEATAQYTNILLNRLQSEINTAASMLETKANNNDEQIAGIREFALKLREIELPRDHMPPREYEPVEFSFLDDAKR